ncbi:MAG TPA: di-heme oxidoredictase family protein, partial [Vicinamibacteria bacterium]|nr:di-heme oxidoredictase family protein [Vicinamibacteria bacterium]
LHDDRAGTLREAILLHGEDSPPPSGDPARSEAQEARDGFAALTSDEQSAVITFLKSLVNFSPDK